MEFYVALDPGDPVFDEIMFLRVTLPETHFSENEPKSSLTQYRKGGFFMRYVDQILIISISQL